MSQKICMGFIFGLSESLQHNVVHLYHSSVYYVQGCFNDVHSVSYYDYGSQMLTSCYSPVSLGQMKFWLVSKSISLRLLHHAILLPAPGQVTSILAF